MIPSRVVCRFRDTAATTDWVIKLSNWLLPLNIVVVGGE
jgi:hypothetical protein